MPNGGETITENLESSIENLNIEHWEDVHMTNTLRLLNGEDQTSFYRIEGEKVVYDIETVKKYLTHICKKEDGTLKTWKEMTDDIRAENIQAEIGGGSTTTRTTAVQIALEYLGYDVGKIDGNQGGNTEKAIKKFQREHNLKIDGQPRPEVIDYLLNDFKVVENNKERGELFGKKLKESNMDKYLKANSDEGSIEMKDTLLKIIEKGENSNYLNSLINNIRKILGLSDEIKKSSGYWAIHIEYQDSDDINEFMFYDSDSFLYQINGLGMDIKYFPIKSVKLIQNYFVGCDAEILSTIDTRNSDGTLALPRDLEKLYNFGITMEDSKEFLDKYMEIKKIKNLNEISDYNDFFNEEMCQKMIEFLFGTNIGKIKSLLPINIYDGLKFYKLKCIWGENKFKKNISSMINRGILTNDSINDIGLLINIEPDELETYFEICKYFKRLGVDGFFPNLEGYTPSEYLKIIRYMGEYSVNFLYGGIKMGEILFKNNIQKEAIEFLFFSDINRCNYDPIPLFKELFENENGKNLFMFLSKYPQKLKNLGGKEINEIELTTKQGGYNFCFRGILEMIKSRSDIDTPQLPKNFTKSEEDKWRHEREKIIKEYENVLRNYISLDKDEKGNDIPRNHTFDKVFYANAKNHKDEDWNGALQLEPQMDNVLKNFTKNFEDCSSVIDENGNIDQNNQKIMIKKIKNYAIANPDKKILVCVNYHGAENGASTNGWEKEDRLELSNISPNIKIISTRCYFGCAYNNNNQKSNNYIHSIKSPVSGFSNNESAIGVEMNEALRQGYEKGLGFHELEIYTRLHYDYSFTPLTDFVDYTDFNTGKKRHGKIGIADAGNGRQSEDDVYYG